MESVCLLNVRILLLSLWIFPSPELPAGRVSEDLLKQHEPRLMWSNLDDRMTILPPFESQPDLRALRVNYPAGKWGSDESGAQFMIELPPKQSYVCEYFVQFSDGFDFARGGKLPGLAGGEATSGIDRPSGDGWTARYMWRRGGEAVLYLYHMDQAKDYGDDLELGVTFLPGRWHSLRQEIRVNDPGKQNGRVRVWFDNNLVLDRSGIRLRTGEKAPVDRFYFSTFFGGKGPEWAPDHDVSIYFAAVRVDEVREAQEAK